MRSYLTLLFLTLLCTCVRAQNPVTFGQQYKLPSSTLAEDRLLNVLLPREYADSTIKKYPVIYLLDGAVSEDFFHVAGLVRYYEDHGMMPPVILVGIANTDRKRDMTYPSSDPRDRADFPTTGGSANFIRFLQKELPQWTETTFRTTNYSTLIGQSLAGLLATEVLLKYPGHYDDYIIISPSLWWDREGLCQQMDSLTAALTDLPQRVFLSAGTEYPVMVNGSRKLAQLLEDRTDATFLHLPAEDHNTILHEALNRAFDQWYDPTVIRPYLYANDRNGLLIHKAPSLDSSVVGTLAYGQALGYIPGVDPVVDNITSLPGSWVFIGSDPGRGWVFDAWVSPFQVRDTTGNLEDFVRTKLGAEPVLDGFPTMPLYLYESIYVKAITPDVRVVAAISDYHGTITSRFIFSGLSAGQAVVIARNLMEAEGVAFETVPDTKFWVVNLGENSEGEAPWEISYYDGKLYVSHTK